ncbi:MAG: LacI family DNA-binding transcriptional regulator, partial [Caulobacterales bacterium]|nr:LacI family DNA-binding transcriptional regulator [Caulobacterales bacterium]
MATIYDVAKKAKVSSKTVSRVINGDSKVKESTREFVLEIMRELDYRPNQQARQLRLGGKSGIGLLLEDPDSGYQTRFQSAMLYAAMEAGR